VGVPASFSAAPADRTSATTVAWAFGDGGTANGASVTHTFAAPGTFTVRVAATDGAGNRVEATRTVTVTAAVTAPPVVPSIGAKGKLGAGKAAGGATRITALTISKLAKGDKVTLKCSNAARGCTPKAKATVKVKKGAKASLTQAVRGLVLQPKAKLTVTITRKGLPKQVLTWTMVKGKAPQKG
jgi:PKD repeat protein